MTSKNEIYIFSEKYKKIVKNNSIQFDIGKINFTVKFYLKEMLFEPSWGGDDYDMCIDKIDYNFNAKSEEDKFFKHLLDAEIEFTYDDCGTYLKNFILKTKEFKSLIKEIKLFFKELEEAEIDYDDVYTHANHKKKTGCPCDLCKSHPIAFKQLDKNKVIINDRKFIITPA